MEAQKTVGNGVGSVAHQVQPGKGIDEVGAVKVPNGFSSFNPYRQLSHNFLVPADLAQRGVSSRAQLVYGLLRKYAGQDGRCFVGRKRMASDLECSTRTVERALKELVSKKLIVRYTKELGGKAFTMFLKPDEAGDDLDAEDTPTSEVTAPPDKNDGGGSSKVSVPPVKSVGTPSTEMTVPPVKNVGVRGLVKEVQEKEEEKHKQAARAACGVSSIGPKTKDSEGGEGVPGEKHPYQIMMEACAAEDREKVISLLFAAHPKLNHPEKTRKLIEDFLDKVNGGNVLYAYMATCEYARIVQPLKDCPDAWVYVVGSETWFREKRWLWETTEHWHAWAKAEGAKFGIPASEFQC